MDIALALGGGGARGLAHIGVLRVLEREGVRVRAVSGTSMGGIIAATVACGMSADDIARKAADLDIREMLQLRPTGPALFGLEKLETWLVGLFDERTFEDLPIPLAVTAVDLTSCQEIVIRSGRLVAGLMATIALPGIFPPQIIGEHRLVDGGTLDPVPVRPARAMHAGPVVAVVLSPEQGRWPGTRTPSPLGELPVVSFVARIRPLRALEIFQQAMEITYRMHTELHLRVDRPEVIVRPEVWHVGLFDNPSLGSISAQGEQAMQRSMPELRSQFTPHRRLWRWLKRRVRRESG